MAGKTTASPKTKTAKGPAAKSVQTAGTNGRAAAAAPATRVASTRPTAAAATPKAAAAPPVNRAAALFQKQNATPPAQRRAAMVDGWAQARDAALGRISGQGGTTLPLGEGYIGKLTRMDVIDTKKGRKIKWIVTSADPAGQVEEWNGPIDQDDPQAMEWALFTLGMFGVDLNSLTGPEDIDQDLCNQIVESGPGVRFSIVQSPKDARYNNTYLNQPVVLPDDFLAGADAGTEDATAAAHFEAGADDGVEDLSDDSVEDLSDDGQLGEGSAVSFTGKGGVQCSGVIKEIQADGKVVVTNDEDGKNVRLASIDKVAALAAS